MHVFYGRQKAGGAAMEWCTSKENCRRKSLLLALGSTEAVLSTSSCCDVCGIAPSTRLAFEYLPCTVGLQSRRRVPAQTVDKDLQNTLVSTLLQEWDAYIDQHPQYKFIGPEFVCSKETIASQARYIRTTQDLGDKFSLRSELREKFFNTLVRDMCEAPAPKRSRCV